MSEGSAFVCLTGKSPFLSSNVGHELCFSLLDKNLQLVFDGCILLYQSFPISCCIVIEYMAKSNSITGPDSPWGFQEVEAPRFQDSRHMKVLRLPALRTGRFYPPGNIPGTHFCYRLSRPQGHSAAGRIMLMKNCNDNIGNRTRDLPACSAVHQPTAPPRAPVNKYILSYHIMYHTICLISYHKRQVSSRKVLGINRLYFYVMGSLLVSFNCGLLK